MPRSAVSNAERGRIGRLTVEQVDRLAEALDGQVDLRLRWRGDELDRLLNRDHSALHEQVARLFLGTPGWVISPEVSFSIYGERGIIDVLAWHESSRRLLVIELKTAIVDVQELIGSLDRKRRLARRIASDRGWPSVGTSAWLVIADSRTNDRRIAAHRLTLRNAFPTDGRSMRAWLATPSGDLAAMSTVPCAAGASIRVPLADRRRATGLNRGSQVGRRGSSSAAGAASGRQMPPAPTSGGSVAQAPETPSTR